MRSRVDIDGHPPEVLTSCEVGNFSKYGIEFSVMRGECVRIGALDAQRPCGKGIFGCGFLMSRAATERAAAERAATEWELSHREREMIERLESGEVERSLFTEARKYFYSRFPHRGATSKFRRKRH